MAAQLPGEQAAKSAKEKAQESARKKEQDAQDRAQIAESRRLDEAKKLEEITSAVEQLNLNPPCFEYVNKRPRTRQFSAKYRRASIMPRGRIAA